LRSLKILAVVPAIDMALREFGMNSVWWQFLKALNELGHEVVLLPFYGGSVETPWWRSYPNPLGFISGLNRASESLLTNLPFFSDFMDYRQKTSTLRDGFIRMAMRTYRRTLRRVAQREKGFDLAVFFSIPMRYLSGIPTELREQFGFATIYYDGDAPASLPRYGGLSTGLYEGGQPHEYDAIIVTSKGSLNDVRELGGKRVHFMAEGADPSVFSPLRVEKEFDISFFGIGAKFRKNWIESMITKPSLMMPKATYVIAGIGFDKLNLGRARNLGMTNYRRFCCSSRVNLHIARQPLAEVYASSSSRLFELACMGCCIVCNPIEGLSEWFEEGKELFVVHSSEEAVKQYEHLLADDEARARVGGLARKKVLERHTYLGRAAEMVEFVSSSGLVDR